MAGTEDFQFALLNITVPTFRFSLLVGNKGKIEEKIDKKKY